MSNGKPSALNYALKYAKGEIVAVFDADNVPEPNALKRAVKYFHDSSVAAVQGRLCVINADENMLTKIVRGVGIEAYLKGKDALGLFVPLKGTCQFVKRNILVKLNGFNEDVLSEDMGSSAKLTEKDHKIRYASDVYSWQEASSRIRPFFTQRTRWYRGAMQVAFKYGRLMTKPNRRNLDAELTLIGPFILITSLVSYFSAFYVLFTAFNLDALLQFLMQISAIGTSIMLALCG
ncbi:MAG: glycosyltransferase family 2 protein [Nitrososphaeria archaeon]